MLNPSETGHCEGDWRLNAHLREQWTKTGTPYQSVSLAYDQKVYYYSILIGTGIQAIREQVYGNGLSKNYINLSLAYQHTINEYNIGIGMQPGIGYYAFSPTDMSSPNQFNYETGLFDAAISGGEPFENDRNLFFNLNLGFRGTKKFDKFQPAVGIAFLHLNKPKDNIFDSEQTNRMPVQLNMEVSTKYNVSRHFTCQPTIHGFFSGKSRLIQTGSYFYLNTKNEDSKMTALNVGVHYKTGTIKSMAFSGGIRLSGFHLQLSYDEFIENQQISNLGSSFEIVFTYFGINTLFDKKVEPCEIY